MIDKQTISRWTVLVVDDEPDSLDVVMLVLNFHGAKVHTASDGREGLALARELKSTFILSDLSMPRMDGWAMLHQLQSDSHTANIPVIALTAHGMRGDRERAIGAGFHYYLLKPLSPLTFLDDLIRLFVEQPVPEHLDPLGILRPAGQATEAGIGKDGDDNE